MRDDEFNKADAQWMDYLHTPPNPNHTLDLSNTFKLGIVGYSESKFNTSEARRVIHREITNFQNMKGLGIISIVSGLTNIGIPEIAYYVGSKFCGMSTVGIACSKAEDFDCFPVDEKHIIGSEWGDESEFFLNYIDALIRVGGGPQSHKEVAIFKEKYPEKLVVEIELDKID